MGSLGRRLRCLVVLAGGGFASIAALLSAAPRVQEATTVVDPASGSSPAFATVGSASCSAKACHGGTIPVSTGDLSRDEYVQWVSFDKHTAAYNALHTARAKAIADLLPEKIPAHRDPRCLACHALPATAHVTDGDETLAVERQSFGTGCESCHGPASTWLGPHTLSSWKSQSPTAKAALGMEPLGDLAMAAKACAGCHVGAPPDPSRSLPLRDVNHDFIAAGHPRLRFEFSRYLQNLPPHWNWSKRSAEPRFLERAWLVGRLIVAQASLDMLAYHASHADRAPWPEFADLDCFACHHALRGQSWRQTSPTHRRPGRWPMAPWPMAQLEVILKVAGKPESVARLATLQQVVALPIPNPATIADHARALKSDLEAIVMKVSQAEVAPEVLTNLRRALADQEAFEALPNWDVAAQTALAVEALTGNADARASIDAFYELLVMPKSVDSPQDFRRDAAYEQSLRAAWSKVQRQLRSEGANPAAVPPASR